jgi:hypothetical protein
MSLCFLRIVRPKIGFKIRVSDTKTVILTQKNAKWFSGKLLFFAENWSKAPKSI